MQILVSALGGVHAYPYLQRLQISTTESLAMGKASRKKKERKLNKWELMEHAVSLLEQCLTPDAKVERDQWLTNHRTSGGAKEPHTRQCDVVIRKGSPPREDVWIVEVQKRGRKVEQADYDGWITKMDQVGASGLIAVSEKGFPQSVIDDAKTRGPRVKLFTLSELEGKDWPIVVTDREVQISDLFIDMKVMEVRVPSLAGVDAPSTLLRRADTGANVTPEWLIQEASKHKRNLYEHLDEGVIPDVSWEYIPSPEVPIEVQCGPNWLPITKIIFTVDLVLKRHRLPLTCAGYRPVDFGPILAYALTAAGHMGGKEVTVRVIARKFPDQSMRILAVETSGIKNLSSVAVSIRNTKGRPSTPGSSTRT